jgi:hypothetical protein
MVATRANTEVDYPLISKAPARIVGEGEAALSRAIVRQRPAKRLSLSNITVFLLKKALLYLVLH